MYEEFFELMHTPFTRDIPADRLYSSRQIEDALGRLAYVADRQLFAVVTADPGCGKSTLIRMFESRLPKDKYMLLYLSDSKLTPRWLYAGLLDQMGLEARFYRGDSKRQLQKEIETVRTVQKKKVVFVLDEAHLLGKETLEEFRFLLNYRFDSASPMSLILVGQTELWDQKAKAAELCGDTAKDRYEYRTEPPGQGRNRQIYRGTYGVCRSETGSVHQWSRR